MTAAEIREKYTKNTTELYGNQDTVAVLAEIAAQLAEANDLQRQVIALQTDPVRQAKHMVETQIEAQQYADNRSRIARVAVVGAQGRS
jgi:type II secretory pathway component GspD/PulD (secretin)